MLRHNAPYSTSPISPSPSPPYSSPEVDFLDEIQTKFFRVFLLAIQSHLYSTVFPSDFYFLKLTQTFTVSKVGYYIQYTVKEKGGKPDRKPHPLPYGLRNPYRNIKSENS
jgi:hypothetical protein